MNRGDFPRLGPLLSNSSTSATTTQQQPSLAAILNAHAPAQPQSYSQQQHDSFYQQAAGMFGSLGRTAASVLGGGGGGGSSSTSGGGQASFGADDFPALGALGSVTNASSSAGVNATTGLNSSNNAVGGGAGPGLPPGAGIGMLGSSGGSASGGGVSSGSSGAGAGAVANGAAEQASALAALQHQHAAREQHRQNLLGSMNSASTASNNGSSGNGSGNAPGTTNGTAGRGMQPSVGDQQQQPLNAAKGGFGEPERNYATKLGAGAGNAAWLAAGGVLPPGINVAGAGNSLLSGTGLNGVGAASSPMPSNASAGAAGTGPDSVQQQRAVAVGAAQAGVQHGPHEAAMLAAAQAQAQAQAAQVQHLSSQQQQQQQQHIPTNSNPTGEVAQTPAQQVLLSPADRFGLVGLLSIIKMPDPDLSMLALGADLSKLGLNMNSSEPLSASFLTPWSELATAAGAGDGAAGGAATMAAGGVGAPLVEPDFHLPSCYNVQPPPPAQTKIGNFSDETLFFVFYSAPRDVLQELAAQELYNRNWRYHKDLHLWLTKEQNTEPTQKTPQYERGNYVFFDPGPWEKITKNFTLYYESLEEKPAAQAHIAQQAAAAAAHHAQQQVQARRAAHQQQQQQRQQQQQQRP